MTLIDGHSQLKVNSQMKVKKGENVENDSSKIHLDEVSSEKKFVNTSKCARNTTLMRILFIDGGLS